MNQTLNVFLDRSPSATLPKELSEYLKSMNLIEDSDGRVSFCGMLMLQNEISIFLPRSSIHETMSRTEKIEIASTTLKAVEKYGRAKATKVELRDENDGAIGLSQLSLIRGILEDFVNYGIYTRRKVIRSINNAKPDWGRTISRSIAAVGKGGVPVYLDIHSLNKRTFTDSEVSSIHANIVRHLDKNFSWVLTGRDGLLAPELNDYPEPSTAKAYQIYVLQRELQQTYADRDIRLLKLLIKYLKEEQGTEESTFITGLKSFHFAWEFMLKQVLSDVIEVNNLLPAPCYIDHTGKVLSANEKSMRTDIVVLDQTTDTYTVLDAKYYAATSPENAPGWGDLVKQFFYAKALKSLYPKANIKNIFVFPGTATYLKQARVRDRTILPTHFYDEDFPAVECIYVCPLAVINHFAAGRKFTALNKEVLSFNADPLPLQNLPQVA